MQLFIRTANAFARMDRNRLRLAVFWVALFITLTEGYFLVRDVRDIMQLLPIKSLWQKEQSERDVDVVEACAYDETHTSHDSTLPFKISSQKLS
jgi:hypothetical protein